MSGHSTFLGERFMSFLSKLTNRLMKSSSLLREGVEDALSDDPDASNEGGRQGEIDPLARPEQTEPVRDESVRGVLPGLFAKRASPRSTRKPLDQQMLENLEDMLITADLGFDVSSRITAQIAEDWMGRRLGAAEVLGLLTDEVVRILEPVATPMPIYEKKPQVVLAVGVNGSGKTTTLAKLAARFRESGMSVIIAAGDTFRAAAVEQLEIWGERAGVPVHSSKQGTDPASVAFDALARAENENADILLIDTAGRLQNRSDLMAELEKIVRVLRKRDTSAPHNTLLVLDATTGQNAINQAEVFTRAADVSGLIMTKLDGTAKGGVLVSIADRYGLPIHAIGIGEGLDDLQPFDAKDFARALTGHAESH